jgi:hypothetical protein
VCTTTTTTNKKKEARFNKIKCYYMYIVINIYVIANILYTNDRNITYFKYNLYGYNYNTRGLALVKMAFINIYLSTNKREASCPQTQINIYIKDPSSCFFYSHALSTVCFDEHTSCLKGYTDSQFTRSMSSLLETIILYID